MQLYDFKLQYPEADVQPFLVKSHQFFQDFIEQGLRDIDQARKNQNLITQTNNQYSTGKYIHLILKLSYVVIIICIITYNYVMYITCNYVT